MRRPLAIQEMPLKIVGSTEFGRYPKISQEQTFNMIISDNWLVPYAGYVKSATLEEKGRGRALFNSTRSNRLISVIDNNIYAIDENLVINKIANIETFNGDVFIDENDASQIAICDKRNIYIYNYSLGTFQKVTTDFVPGYVAFQDGYFIASDLNNAQWRLSELNNGLVWPADSSHVGLFQTKPDNVIACVRVPGKENQLFVFGKTVTQHWTDIGYTLFPYQKSTGFNIDYGCLSAATIASGDTFVVFLGTNEKSGPVIMVTDGGSFQQISNDGINFKLAQLKYPSESYGYLFKQDGHLFYTITFSNAEDNFSLTYDFNTKMFFTLCDEKMNHFIAKRVSYFDEKYYFVSFNDGCLYELNSNYMTYDGKEIPRIRVCPAIRQPNSEPFVVNYLSFPVEQGHADEIQRIDLTISNDGGVSFGNSLGMEMNSLGHRRSIFKRYGLGRSNDFTVQLRFWGHNRFVLSNGVVGVYQ